MGGIELELDVERELAAVIAQARGGTKAEAVCVRVGGGVRLEIWGALPPRWVGSLSLHCCGVGLNIESGLGCRFSSSQWAARLQLSADRTQDVHAFDFLRMARREPSGATRGALPRLDGFEIVRQPGGGVAVSLQGLDQPGFLAGVIQRFALFGLHPERFSLGSTGDRALDFFVLRAVGGSEPSPACVAALRGALNACVSSPSTSERGRT